MMRTRDLFQDLQDCTENDKIEVDARVGRAVAGALGAPEESPRSKGWRAG